MSQEEFDNRLKRSFEDEYLPPGDHLWANISGKLDQQSGKPVWYWLLPVALLMLSGLIWLALPSGKPNDSLAVSEQANALHASGNATAATAPLPLRETPKDPDPEKRITRSTEAESLSYRQPSAAAGSAAPRRSYTRGNSLHWNGQTELEAENAPQNPSGTISGEAGNAAAPEEQTERIGLAAGAATESVQQTEAAGISFLRAAGLRKFLYNYTLPEVSGVHYNALKTVKIPEQNAKKSYRQNASFADLDSKHWLNFGIGPQQSINRLVISDDSQAWVHRHLWDNKYKMTGNGIGLHAFASYAYKFGKNRRFSFEAGLEYNLRTENIRLNENSYDIASRDSTNKIQKYVQVILLQLVVYNPVTGRNDTTNYLAASNYSMAVSNRYHCITIPLHFNAEFKLSGNTYFSAGLGAGISMISSRETEHIDMIWGESKKQEATRMFSGSLNSRLSLYTNFNDFGQIGIYSGFRMYASPWEVSTKQYAIGMSDLQFGITFKKPL